MQALPTDAVMTIDRAPPTPDDAVADALDPAEFRPRWHLVKKLAHTGMKLSVIIANYNYADFVGAAISSALGVDWPEKEVIVVDDASTDDSRTIIERFRGRIAAYFRPKSHQLGAHMFGFERSSGDVVIFLD